MNANEYNELKPYLDEVGRYPLLKPKEELKFAKEIYDNSRLCMREIFSRQGGIESMCGFYEGLLERAYGGELKTVFNLGQRQTVQKNLDSIKKILEKPGREKSRNLKKAAVLLEEIVNTFRVTASNALPLMNTIKAVVQDYMEKVREIQGYNSFLNNGYSPKQKKILRKKISDIEQRYGKNISEISDTVSSAYAKWEKARNIMIRSNLRLVIDIAYDYIDKGLSLPDLVSEGNVGLIIAVEKFEYWRKYRFSTYSSWWIKQTIRRAITNKSREVRIPAYLLELKCKMDKVISEFVKKYKRKPTENELACLTEVAPEKISLILRKTGKETFCVDYSDFESPVEKILGPEESASIKHDSVFVEKMLQGFPEREREICLMRFGVRDGIEYTLEEIGQRFKLTRERVRQLLKKEIIEKLQNRLHAKTA